MKLYSVDLGEGCKRWTQRKLEKHYVKHVDKTKYATISDWMWAMIRNGLITEIV